MSELPVIITVSVGCCVSFFVVYKKSVVEVREFAGREGMENLGGDNTWVVVCTFVWSCGVRKLCP